MPLEHIAEPVIATPVIVSPQAVSTPTPMSMSLPVETGTYFAWQHNKSETA
jgi:hypothetical protein